MEWLYTRLSSFSREIFPWILKLLLHEKEEDFEGFLTRICASDVTTFLIIQWHFQTDLKNH